jgi:hypothetical protein
MLTSPAIAHAQNLLINGNLNALDTASNPNSALYYDVPTGWNISTTPQSFPQPSNPSPPIVRYPAYPASFADRLGITSPTKRRSRRECRG